MLKKILQLSTCLIITLALSPAFAYIPITTCGATSKLEACIGSCRTELQACINKIKGEMGMTSPAYACCKECLNGSDAFRRELPWNSLNKCKEGFGD